MIYLSDMKERTKKRWADDDDDEEEEAENSRAECKAFSGVYTMCKWMAVRGSRASQSNMEERIQTDLHQLATTQYTAYERLAEMIIMVTI